jgi:hypothetical protein
MALVDLYLIGHNSCTELLVEGVLQVPIRAGLLYELAHNVSVDALGLGLVVNDEPDLEILAGIAILILEDSLPCYDVGSERREAKLVDVIGRKGRYDGTGIGVDNGDSEGLLIYVPGRAESVLLFRRCPGKVASAGRVRAAAEVSLRSEEFSA